MSRISDYHRWLVQRARNEMRQAEDNFAEVQKNPKMSNADVDKAREIKDAAWDVLIFVELADPCNYAAHKRDKRTRREQGL